MSHPPDADPPVLADDTGPAAAVDDSGAAPRRRRSPRKRLDAQQDGDHGGGSVAVPGNSPIAGNDGPRADEIAHGADVPTEAGEESTDASLGVAADSARAGDEGASRRSRRNRRRGRKGRASREDGGEGGSQPGTGPGAPAARPAPQPPLQMPDASDLFATVTSGAFDAEALAADGVVDVNLDALEMAVGSPAQAGAAGQAANDDFSPAAPASVASTSAPPDDANPGPDPSRRVLLPDAEAPKLQKVLAQAGAGSRRDLEQMILDKRVTVNGQPAHTGQRVSWGDRVEIDGKPVRVRIAPLPARVIAYHKPAGEVVSHDDPQQRPTVFRRLPRLPHGKWQSVGRLDINTEGLLLFTTSGELANQLMHPRFGVEREYAVRVLGTVDSEARARLLEGVQIEGQAAAFKSLEDGGGEGANHWYRVVITEGRNREVRRLFEAVGLTVSRLIRIRYGSVVLPRGLKRGVCVDLAEDDVRLLRRLTGLGNPGDGPHGARNNRRGPRDDAGPGPQHAGTGEARGERGPRKGQGPRQEPRREPRNDAMPREQRRPPPERGPRPMQPGQPSHANQTHGGRQRPQAAFGDAAVHAHEFDERDHVEVVEVSHIPNPLQQTFDQRAIREARSARRELSDDAPIPNPLQQTYDKRALKENREPRRDTGDDDGPIPNPLQQTYDKRFAQGGGAGGGGAGPRGRSNGAGGGRRKPGGAGGKAPGGQPDPMKTAVGYIGGDAFLRKKTGGRGGKGGGGGGPGGSGGGNRRGGRGGPGGAGGPGNKAR